MSSRAAKATSRATRSRAEESGAGTRKDVSSRLPGPSKQKPAKPSEKVRASLSVDGVTITEFPVPRIERQLESLNSASEDLQKQLGLHDARLSAVEDDVRELREEIAQFVAALLKPVNPEKQFLESKDSKLYGAPSVFPDTNIHIRFLKLHNEVALRGLRSSNECAWRCTFLFNSIERMFMNVSHCHTTPKHECVCMCTFNCNPVKGMYMNVHMCNFHM